MPREWPPITVVWVAVLLVGPPLGLWTFLGPNDKPNRAGVGAMAAVGMLTATGLLLGRRGGYLVGWLVTAGHVWFMLSHVWEHRNLWPGPARLVLILPAGVTLAYVTNLAALLWWPETRRWCGLLPRDDDD